MNEQNSLIVTKLIANGRDRAFIDKICELRKKYDILMELTTPEIIALQKDALLLNYKQSDGRLLASLVSVRDENGNSVYKSIYQRLTK